MAVGLQCHADMAINGGDIFHHDRPSRTSVVRCMEAMRKYVFGPRPVRVNIVSDQSKDFAGPTCFDRANFADPNLSVQLPVFAVTGNHDPAVRDHADSLPISALDVLQTAGLLNLYGRQRVNDRVVVRPVLLRKGRVQLALYGMANMRDQRLAGLVRKGRVLFAKPPAGSGHWYSVLVVH